MRRGTYGSVVLDGRTVSEMPWKILKVPRQYASHLSWVHFISSFYSISIFCSNVVTSHATSHTPRGDTTRPVAHRSPIGSYYIVERRFLIQRRPSLSAIFSRTRNSWKPGKATRKRSNTYKNNAPSSWKAVFFTGNRKTNAKIVSKGKAKGISVRGYIDRSARETKGSGGCCVCSWLLIETRPSNEQHRFPAYPFVGRSFLRIIIGGRASKPDHAIIGDHLALNSSRAGISFARAFIVYSVCAL